MFTESQFKLRDWRQKRYIASRELDVKARLMRAFTMFKNNSFTFTCLILIYLIAQLLGNSIFILAVSRLSSNPENIDYRNLVTFKSSWPIKIWNSYILSAVLYTVCNSAKRKDHQIFLSDILAVRKLYSIQFFIATLLTDTITGYPIIQAYNYFRSNTFASIIWLLIGFVINWLFSFTRILFLNQNVDLPNGFIWSALIATSPQYYLQVIFTPLISFAGFLVVLITPISLAYQVFLFYDLFGYPNNDSLSIQ